MDTITFKQLRNLTEDEAREILESIRWPDGIVCPSAEAIKALMLCKEKLPVPVFTSANLAGNNSP